MSIDWKHRSRFPGPWHSPGFLLWQVTHEWQRRINRSLENLDLTQMQFVLLAGVGWLSHQGKPVNQKALADFCQISSMQVSQVVRLLDHKELLERHSDQRDARARHLRLTLKGKRRLESALKRVEAEDVHFFSRETRSESLKALFRMLGEGPLD